MTQEWDAGRLDSDLEGVGFDTLAVRAGQHRTPESEHSDPLFFTSSYVFRTAADAAATFAGDQPGNVYSRYTNPTVHAFEERIAALEGGEQAVATSTGMSAILATVMSLCSAGDHVLVSKSVFGSTISLFEKYFKRFGVQVDYVPLAELSGWDAADALEPSFVEFGQTVGLDLVNEEPRQFGGRARELREYDLIIDLAGGAKNHMAKVPFHTTLLRWRLENLTDPEAVHTQLVERLGDLMTILRGEDDEA